MVDIPLLNDYKKAFLKKRLPQTALGGVKLKLGYSAPLYIYLLQIILLILPLLLGVAFTTLTQYDIISLAVGLYVYGALIILYTFTTNILSYIIRRKKSSITPLNTARNLCGEDEVIQFTSCCAVETIEFIIPGRKLLINVFLHSIVSGPLCSLGLWYLHPTTLNDLYGNNTIATSILCALGWINVTIAQYSLTTAGPPEWATYRSMDPLELNMLSRPFHCVCFYSIFILARFFSILLLTDQILHGVFCCLWLLWLAGWLPPMDAFILWGFEQAHVYLFGGSPMATDFWNVVYILWTSVFFVIALMIPDGTAGLIACSCFGYFLSTDLSVLARNIALCCCPKIVPQTNQELLFEHADLGFFWSYGPLEFCLIYFLMLMVGGLTACLNFFVVDKASISSYLGYTLIGLWVIQAVLSECQKVTVLCGLIRSQLYPVSVQRTALFLARKKKLLPLGIIRRIILNFVGPFTMVAYMSLVVDWSGKELPWQYNNNNSVRFWDVIAVNRGYRWIFQSTPAALFEFSIAHILKVSLPSTDTLWLPIGLATQLLIIGAVRDRLTQVCNKGYLVLALLITNWTDNKQRRRSTRCTIILNIIISPLILVLILIASVFAAPLLPLFTLPIFLLGFPRPIRSWPGTVGAAANVCEDTVYYEQSCPLVAKAIRTSFANGSLGDPTPGDHYLLRFQDRLMWIQVLERGYFYVKVSIKGLELQETSCHSAEAIRIDDVIEQTYERADGYKCCTRSSCHPFPLTVLRPYDAAIVKTYSDARNQLTGVIDSPEVLKAINTGFLKTLVWVAVGQVYWNHRNAEEGRAMFDVYDYDDDDSRTSSALSDYQKSRPSSAKSMKVNKVVSIDQSVDGIPKAVTVRRFSNHSARSSWSDDREAVMMSPVQQRNVSLATGTSSKSWNQQEFAAQTVDYGAKNQSVMSGSVDDLLDELNTYGRTSTNMMEENRRFGMPNNSNQHNNKYHGNSTNIAGDFEGECKSKYSSHMSPPAHWREMPTDSSTLKPLLSEFPVRWYQHIISFLKFKPKDGKNSQAIANDITGDDVLLKKFSQVVIGCYMAVNNTGAGPKGVSHVHKVYQGHLPPSELASWIEDKPELYSLTIQAYRMAVKLAIDEAVLRPASNLEELHDYLDSYDSNWYIGMETDRAWKYSILRHKQQCFALSKDEVKNTYNSRVLTLQDTPIYMSSINCESVRAQWANLNMELLYMTNDDDERYSIQAHPALLRNLTVQAADPPLGYPIYSSEPVSVPTL